MDRYQQFISEFKIAKIRAEYIGEKEMAEQYKKIYKKLETIKESRHLALIGEQSTEKIAYKEISEFLTRKGQESFEKNVEYIDDLLSEKYNIQVKNKKDTKQKGNYGR